MQIKYYKFGLSPIAEEIDNEGIYIYYAYQWDTSAFKQDKTYLTKYGTTPTARPRK